ncbi:MAG: hypothetical protein QG646_4358 [Euryarchaeota archaeon]|nr:hypothetical protein [Euryarchaeota archaeon]
MKILGRSKITKQQAKPEISYPLIRLPQSEVSIAGETAYVFKTEYNGKPLYLISLDEEFNGEIKVVQPEVKSDLEARVEALEKEVFKTSNSEKEFSGPAEIRTQDPRRVKAMS